VVDSRKRLTWSHAKKWIDRIALGFLELGLEKDEMIVVQLYNCVELCIIRIACQSREEEYLTFVGNTEEIPENQET
jgi:non-ribosomal peptide synthetase component E (peptide arylation enzyme)